MNRSAWTALVTTLLALTALAADPSASQPGPTSLPVDEARRNQARVVLRVKWKAISPPGGNPSDTVEVLRIFKNVSPQNWGREARIDHEPGRPGVPQDRECTVYLEVSGKLKGHPWMLLGGGAETGVSHVGAWAAQTQPASKSAASQPASAPTDVSKLIADLSSDDGQKRLAATKAIFALGKDAMEPLKQAGAKQLTPLGPPSPRRIDMVYSLLEGFRPNPLDLPRGYHADGFKLHIEKGCTPDDVKKMGARHGFTIPWNFDRNGHAFLGRGNNLADVITAVLSSEPRVITVNVEYFEIMP